MQDNELKAFLDLAAVTLPSADSVAFRLILIVVIMLAAVAFAYWNWSFRYRIQIADLKSQIRILEFRNSRLSSDLLDLMVRTGTVPKPYVAPKPKLTPEEERRRRRAEKISKLADSTDNVHEAQLAKSLVAELNKPKPKKKAS